MVNVEPPSHMVPPTDPTIVGTSVRDNRESDYQHHQHHHHFSPPPSSLPQHHHHHHDQSTDTSTQSHPQSVTDTGNTGSMPPSARSTAPSRFQRSSSMSVSTTTSSSTTPDTTLFKCTPMTVQMTPDYEICGDPIGTTVPKQLCTLLSAAELLEGTLDASSTEAADSSKSSYTTNHEIHEEDDVLRQFGRCRRSDPQTPPKATTTASRTLFARDRHVDDDDDDDDDDEPTHLDHHPDHHNGGDDDDEHLAHNYSDIILMDSTSTPFDTPNHSIATSDSPASAVERAYTSDVSPIHPPPSHFPLRRSLHFRVPPQDMSSSPTRNYHHHNSTNQYYSDTNHDQDQNDRNNNNTARKQLRSRRALRSGSRPKSGEHNGKHRGRKKVSGEGKKRKNQKNCTDYSLPLGEHEMHHNGIHGADDEYSFDGFSTESDDDDFVVEDRSEQSRDSSSTRMKLPHPHSRLSTSSSTSRRNSSSMALTTTKYNPWWKNLSHRLSSTQNLIWMLCFVGLTSVTMIVTMNHHMAQVAHMEEENHLSILFHHPVTNTRGLLLPNKMPPPLKPTDAKKPKIRGSKPATENISKPLTPIKVTTAASKTLESAPTRRTVNLNTLAQLPHENALKELMLSDHRGSSLSTTTSNDHHASSHHHHHHHHSHEHGQDESHHHAVSDQQQQHHHHHHSHHDASEQTDKNEEEPEPHPHHHHHHQTHDHSIRLYVKASPSRTGLDAIRKVAVPENWDDDRVQLSFDRIDPFLYGDNFVTDPTVVPRIVFLDGEYFVPSSGERIVRRHRSEITDSTQLYSILDSGDERIASMELRAPYVQGECVPMKEWQTTFNPSCNGMHELDLASMGDNRMEDDFKLFGMNGFWRNAWRYDSTGGHSSLKERDTVVLKTLRINHRFEDAYFENNRIDAVVLERLTASPHVINVFGFCGHSVLTEFADGKRLGELADKMAKVPLARLQIARDIANGLADVHGIDGDDNATFVHLDINPANVVSIGGTLKLNDFNIGVLRRWNTTSNTPCGIPAKYPNPQWRSPEEARLEENLTEKVDVFSLGHIFFRLICGHEPWHKLEPGGMPSKEELSEKVRQGILPTIPEEIMASNDPEVVAVREAMLRCYTYDPIGRPSAREIAIYLQQSLNALETDANSTKVLIE